MRVLRSVAVSREVLPAARHPACLQSLRERDTEPRHAHRVAAEAAVGDDGIVGVRVHVHDRRVVVIDSAGGQFFRDELPEPLRNGRSVHPRNAASRVQLSDAAHARQVGPVGGAQALHPAAFLVDGNEQRFGRRCLERARQLGDLRRVDDIAPEEDHSGDPAPDELQLFRRGRGALDSGDQAARGELFVVHLSTHATSGRARKATPAWG